MYKPFGCIEGECAGIDKVIIIRARRVFPYPSVFVSVVVVVIPEPGAVMTFQQYN